MACEGVLSTVCVPGSDSGWNCCQTAEHVCVIGVFGMGRRDLAENSRQHRLELITLYPQVRDEIQTGTYNPNKQLGWNRGSQVQVVRTCPREGNPMLSTTISTLYTLCLMML